MRDLRIDFLDVCGIQRRAVCLVLFREIHGLSSVGIRIFPGKGVVISIAVCILVLRSHDIAVAVHPDDVSIFIAVEAFQVTL